LWKVGDRMLPINHENIEKFYDVLHTTTLMIHENLKINYIDALILSSNYLLDGEVINDELDEVKIETLNDTYSQLEDMRINPEEIRKAFQLCLLTGFKHLNLSLSHMTPDSMGVLFAYLIDKLYPKGEISKILDVSIGTGNLMIAMLNHLKANYQDLYGIDTNYQFLQIALALASLTDYHIELINQDSRGPLMIPQFDLIIGDLPTKQDTNDEMITTEMISNVMNYSLPGGYLIYLIPNDFFNEAGNDLLKDVILTNTHMQALIALPESMFKTIEARKSILILRKRGEGIEPIKDILVMNFPSFKDQEAVRKAMDKLDDWFQTN
jgi:site-specific DNA-methyltransferase (adenine-specific)